MSVCERERERERGGWRGWGICSISIILLVFYFCLLWEHVTFSPPLVIFFSFFVVLFEKGGFLFRSFPLSLLWMHHPPQSNLKFTLIITVRWMKSSSVFNWAMSLVTWVFSIISDFINWGCQMVFYQTQREEKEREREINATKADQD